MATFITKRRLYSNIVGYTSSQPIYNNNPGVGLINNSTIANTAQVQKQELEIIKQREKQEHELLMEQIKIQEDRNKTSNKLNKEVEKFNESLDNSKNTPDAKLLELKPKALPPIPMNK